MSWHEGHPRDFRFPSSYDEGYLILRRPNGTAEAYFGKYGLTVTRQERPLTADQWARIDAIVREPAPSGLAPVPETLG
jgi:hypothetical protein